MSYTGFCVIMLLVVYITSHLRGWNLWCGAGVSCLLFNLFYLLNSILFCYILAEVLQVGLLLFFLSADRKDLHACNAIEFHKKFDSVLYLIQFLIRETMRLFPIVQPTGVTVRNSHLLIL